MVKGKTHKQFTQLVEAKLKELEETDETYFFYKRLKFLLRYNDTKTVIKHLDKVSDELYKIFRLYDK